MDEKKRGRLRRAPWYPGAVAACIAVALYVLLTRLPGIWSGFLTFARYFRPVVIGCVIAFIVNPLARLFERSLFSRVRREGARRSLSNAVAFVVVVLFLVLGMMMLIPQLADSLQTFADNLDTYVATVNRLMEDMGLNASALNLDNIISSSEALLDTVTGYLRKNLNRILSTSASAGRALVQWGLGFILSIYLLSDKDKLRTGFQRLLRALFSKPGYDGTASFLNKCGVICTRYVVYNLIDSLIIGGINAVFMSIAGMQYVGLVSFVIGVTNLIPTFGPVIGGAVGAFVLLMVRPMHALVFLVFTVILQLCDGYIIKPRLFGSSLGVSGLWILIGVIVGSSMFGVVGILLAIPAVAILDLIYTEYLLPWLEARRRRAEAPVPPPEVLPDEQSGPIEQHE